MLQQADFNPDDFSPSMQSSADESLLVKFFIKDIQDDGETLAQGRPIFRSVEYIDIRTVGDRSSSICRPARHDDKQRFAKHYAAFKQRVELPEEGTLLVEWPMITRSQAEELAYFNVKTVEQLAIMNDTHAQNFMGINALKRKAKEFLEDAESGVSVKDLQAELKARDKTIAELSDRLDALANEQGASSADKSAVDAPDSEPTARSTRRTRRTKKE